jgi:hypothetical protein
VGLGVYVVWVVGGDVGVGGGVGVGWGGGGEWWWEWCVWVETGTRGSVHRCTIGQCVELCHLGIGCVLATHLQGESPLFF